MIRFPNYVCGVIFLLVGMLVFLSLISFDPRDIKYLSSPTNFYPHNIVGIAGGYLAFSFLFTFGIASYVFPLCLVLQGLGKFGFLRFEGFSKNRFIIFFSFFLFLISFSVLIGIFYDKPSIIYQKSGTVGFFLSRFLKVYLGFWGTFIVTFLIAFVNAFLLWEYFFIDLFKGVGKAFYSLFTILRDRISAIREKKTSGLLQKNPAGVYKRNNKRTEKRPVEIKVYTPSVSKEREVKILKEKKRKETKVLLEKNKEKEVVPKGKNGEGFRLPSVDILKIYTSSKPSVEEDIKESISNLEEVLSQFGVPARVVSVQKGPVVTMYELEPQVGVKIHKISALADDIALALKSSSIRIVAPIPGRGTIGVEVPNRKKQTVFLRDVISEKQFIKSTSLLTLAIGKDVKGDPVIADLKDMPHLLIAGTTGSGKTVCVNSLISSILFKATPDQVKFILIDPKMVELAHFSGIPHLITPIISEAKKACSALNWAVEEMETRYRMLAEDGARNIDVYNRKEFRLPYIVIIIDELADLMVVAKDNIETAIQRLAQLSRAVGIHLVLATQRPSVDVITGVIKANFPARISFKVSTKVDSRTVLDIQGAEKLLGKGDLLFLKPGASRIIRAQGSYIDDEDIESLANFWRAQGSPVYEEKILENQRSDLGKIESDELLHEAIKIVLTTRQASASLLQRRLRIGYTRAARLLDLMEKEGIVGPFCGSKARDILVDPQEYLKEKGLV